MKRLIHSSHDLSDWGNGFSMNSLDRTISGMNCLRAILAASDIPMLLSSMMVLTASEDTVKDQSILVTSAWRIEMQRAMMSTWVAAAVSVDHFANCLETWRFQLMSNWNLRGSGLPPGPLKP